MSSRCSDQRPCASRCAAYLSQLPLTSRLPSREALRVQTLPSWPMSVLEGVRGVSEGANEDGSGQMWMSLSCPAVAT